MKVGIIYKLTMVLSDKKKTLAYAKNIHHNAFKKALHWQIYYKETNVILNTRKPI